MQLTKEQKIRLEQIKEATKGLHRVEEYLFQEGLNVLGVKTDEATMLLNDYVCDQGASLEKLEKEL